ncbi:mechanosensitive ion channel [Patescibacteria group bacterium]|nr:mechanosensitive ion channel [Patescibacteria group bacterium]
MFDFDFQTILQSILQWFLNPGLRIFAIIIGGIIVYKIFKKFSLHLIGVITKKTYADQDEEALEKRTKTLAQIFLMAGKIMIMSIVALMILPEFGINIGALLAGLGVLGLAIGFGSQSLVKDIVSGLFILIEDQYRVGDWVNIDGTEGKVEDINLRRTILRGLNGVQYFIIHSTIKKVSNLSKGFSRVDMNIALGYEVNLDRAIEIINKTGKALAQDTQFRAIITKPPEVLGIENIEGDKVSLRILGDTKPGKHWEVARELRKRIKETLTKEEITMK